MEHVARARAGAKLQAAYWDAWHEAFPALHKRGHWHVVHHLCTEAQGGAPLGELLGLTRQALLVDDATVRDRVEELLADGTCITDPPAATLAARTILLPSGAALARYDTTLLALRNALADAAPALQPGLALPRVQSLSPDDRALALETLAALNDSWSALLDKMCAAARLSQARRLEARRHLLSTSHRTILLLAITQRYDQPAGMLADRMAAILLERTGQNFQTTRDHIATLLAFGALERRPGRALCVGLAIGTAPLADATLDTLAGQLTPLVARSGGAAAGAYALRIRSAGAPAHVVAITTWPFTIGRTEGNSLRLAAGDVSRTHCQISRRGADVLVTDLDSTNGTAVNGKPIAGTVPLADGATITLGPFELTFLAPEEATDATVRQRRSATLKVVPQR